MPATIITTEDLMEFKLELFNEIKKLVEQLSAPSETKVYLKSAEVMEMLSISPGTLQNLRINGTLPYSKIGGIILYELKEIERVMEENKVSSY
ncbi:helix-turn-helix domain-containing protein [Aequorivita sp. F47161]|uniref:Helix-turn-helix domain-containing protein n=2 Tax=Aequorivita TaxID=153265 RepID=A0A9X1U9M8_9FLAO|nr:MULTISPECIES: helix-turn-helix domain-containing protein [Aequorivita]MCG2418731.1 helix-turn-helix domain-containing protein [Aequorivita vitellina]WGF91734.1 helix-turn-helix domain-containing protein [Aequorivita sp. Ant34-E75]HNP68751.1 helix-turn-helix domain-containing protein [Aequorivita sp.]